MEEEKAGFQAWMTLLKVHQKIQQRVTSLLAGHGLTLAQFDALVKLYHHEGAT